MTRGRIFKNSRYDFCVIGSGPAGIISALELAKKNSDKSILLVEFGETESCVPNSLDDTIVIHNSQNHHDPYECTNKAIGGSSLTWGGRCVMYDEIDFSDRKDIHDECTWDSGLLDDVASFIPPAQEYFECGDGPFDLNKMDNFRGAPIAEGFEEGDVLDSKIERWSMPTRFNTRYKKQIQKTPNLSFMTGLEARFFSAPDIEGNINSIELRDTATQELFTLYSKCFIICAGAMESTRLLLRNKHVFEKIGGHPPALGRYYQGHVSGKIASVCFSGDPGKTGYGFVRDVNGVYLRKRFQFSDETLKSEKLLNAAIWLDNPLYHDPSHKNGAMSLMYLAMIMPVLGKRLAPPAIEKSITKGKSNKILSHLWNVLRGLPKSLWIPLVIFLKRYFLKRKLPGIFLYNPNNTYALHFHCEQVPREENKMVLSDDGETLEVHYSYSDEDVQSVIRAHEVLDDWLQKCECGKLEYWHEKNQLADAIHKMSKDGIHQNGTTRIANSPDRGVVNKDLRVWGTENIYVCSSSAFPTSSQANPTFLLGAFAVRLAKHLSEKYA